MMKADPFHRAVYLTGPTAVGKTAVGVALAERLGAEVVAMDSMTLYRGLDIGTAKPSAEDRASVPHHLLDVLDPWESASVADYRRWALAALLDVESRGRRALFVGGTPLYLKAMLRGLFEGPSADPSARATLEAEADGLGAAALHAKLAAVDPITAARLHPNDRRRVIRALEVVAATGRPMAEFQTEHDRPAPASVPVFAIDRPRAEVRDRIDRRAGRMFADGLIDEVRALMAGPRPIVPVPAQAAGYAETIDLIAGRLDLAGAIERTRARTRQLAKRQSTWFRGLAEVRPWPVATDEAPESTADRLMAAIEAPGG